ncbi:MAG: hypothetical protein U0T78_04010 [Cloacibacterium normanense]
MGLGMKIIFYTKTKTDTISLNFLTEELLILNSLLPMIWKRF